MDQTSIEWWLDRLESVSQTSSGWTAKCPAHDDIRSSLSLAVSPDGEILVHCFAGCSLSSILEKIDNRPDISVTIQPKISTPSAEWWSSYTGVPAHFWRELGVEFRSEGVAFTWAGTRVQKLRYTGQKVFSWLPPDSASPPLWPSIPETVPATIVLAEGESDTGILQFCGIPSFGVTKGSQTPRLEYVFLELKRRGLQHIVTMIDMDSAGSKFVGSVRVICESIELEFSQGDLSSVIDPLLGEKDIRDAFLRVRHPDPFVQASKTVRTNPLRRYWSVDEFLGRSVPQAQWAVQDLLLRRTVQMVVGHPKLGKTWLVLDLAISIASGARFLGTFDVLTPGPVVLITKEDPDYLLQDRLRKILVSKGLSGSVSEDQSQISISFPESSIPLFLDLNRDFMFTTPDSSNLMSFLDEILATYGSIGLVVIDPTLRMIQNIDEFKAGEIASSVFRISENIRSKYGCGVVLVHHKSKSTSDNIKQSYGSMAFHAFAEGTWYLGNPDPEGFVPVRAEFKSAKEIDWRYRLLDLSDVYNVQAEITDDLKISGSKGDSQISSKILVLLSRITTGMSVPQLSDAIEGSSDYMIRQALKILESQNRVQRRKNLQQSSAGAKGDLWFLANDEDPSDE